MQVTVEEVNTVKKILHVEIPHKDVTKEIDKSYQELKKTSKLRGFRPGKVPRKILESMFKKDVHKDVSAKLINSSFKDVLQEVKEDFILGDPQINQSDLNPDASYKYDMVVELKPIINEITFKGFKLEKNIHEPSDDMVDVELQMLRKQFAKHEPIEEQRPVRDKDYVLVDLEGFIDSEPYDKTPFVENFIISVGGVAIAKKFDDEIIGMNINDEKEIEVDYPKLNSDGTLKKDPDFNSNLYLAGNKITYKLKLREIRYEILPELNDEFVKKELGQFETLDALKEAIVNDLTQGYKKRSEQEVVEQVYEKLEKTTNFELPEIMIKYELDSIVEEAEKSLEANNKTLAHIGYTRETLVRAYLPLATKQVRRRLILDAIASQENLEISNSEFDKSLEHIATSIGKPLEEMKKDYGNDEDNQTINLKQALLEQKSLDFVLEHSNIIEIKP